MILNLVVEMIFKTAWHGGNIYSTCQKQKDDHKHVPVPENKSLLAPQT